MTTRVKEAPTDERPMFTLGGALDLAEVIANRALVDMMPKVIEIIEAHYQANLRESVAAALKDLDGSNGTR